MSTPIINLEIVAIDKKVYDGTVSKIHATTPDGQITILPNHEPLITSLAQGKISVQTTNTNTEKTFEIDGGFLEVRPNKVIILAQTAA